MTQITTEKSNLVIKVDVVPETNRIILGMNVFDKDITLRRFTAVPGVYRKVSGSYRIDIDEIENISVLISNKKNSVYEYGDYFSYSHNREYDCGGTSETLEGWYEIEGNILILHANSKTKTGDDSGSDLLIAVKSNVEAWDEIIKANIIFENNKTILDFGEFRVENRAGG